MKINAWLALVALSLCFAASSAEEKIRGVLEKTAHPDACAQIRDALDETYYINKADATEKMIAKFVGHNIQVVVSGTVETKTGQVLYLNLSKVEPYVAPDKKSAAGKP